jgi:hypothetical protein
LSRYRFVVLSNPVAGREDEFNEWYDKHHLREILAIPGIKSGRRFHRSDAQVSPSHPYEYLAVYEIETDDIAAVIVGLSDSSGRVRSDAIDMGSTSVWIFDEMGPVHLAGPGSGD